MSSAADIEQTAAIWLLRRDEEGWTVEQQAALDAWLNADARHTVAFWRLEQGWSRADRLAAVRGPAPSGAASRRWPPVLAMAASMAVAVGVASLVLIQGGGLGARAYVTEVGAHETLPLPDGSRMELNTATKVRASIDGRVRNVWLDHGEAYFEVAHDRAHPFVVHAGNRTITVLGTKFSVRRDGGQVYVAVVEGRVRVEDAGAPLRKQLAVLTAGDMALTKGSSTLLTPRSADRVADALSWRQGRLIFDQSTLGDAAEEFNRYNRKQLIVTDPAVAKIRIGGDFDADNVDAFVRLLQEAFGLKIQATGEELRISG